MGDNIRFVPADDDFVLADTIYFVAGLTGSWPVSVGSAARIDTGNGFGMPIYTDAHLAERGMPNFECEVPLHAVECSGPDDLEIVLALLLSRGFTYLIPDLGEGHVRYTPIATHLERIRAERDRNFGKPKN